MTTSAVMRVSAFLEAADGTRIAAETLGSGSLTFVVVHGFTGSREKPAVRFIAEQLATRARVIVIDQRGHGHSSGGCTLGLAEPMDVDAAVAWARSLAADPVVTVGFSMGSASVLRHAGLVAAPGRAPDARAVVREAPDAVVSVGGVAEWYFHGSRAMHRLHRITGSRLGRAGLVLLKNTRLERDAWPAEGTAAEHLPITPPEAASRIAAPLLVVHGEFDEYFPTDHGQRIHAAAQAAGNAAATLWVERGMGHAERATSGDLVTRIADWAAGAVGRQA